MFAEVVVTTDVRRGNPTSYVAGVDAGIRTSVVRQLDENCVNVFGDADKRAQIPTGDDGDSEIRTAV